MTQREIDLKAIIRELSIWEHELSNHNTLNLQDANVISEDVICEILNCIYGYKLKNLNAKTVNYAAVDLGDSENGIAFQITTTTSVRKIQDTLDKFVNHEQDKVFENLYILILGKRQKNYPSLKVPVRLNFEIARNVMDFKSLVNQINFLTSSKLSELKKIIVSNFGVSDKDKRSKSNLVDRQKKALSMKKRIHKDFLDHETISENFRNRTPSKRTCFNFGSAIVRQVGDRMFPGGDPDKPSWTKIDFYNLYDYGLEFIGYGGYIIVDSQGYWDTLGLDDNRDRNPNYQKMHANTFCRLAFEDIETYDLEPDGYYGYPTIYCQFKYDGWPFEQILFGNMGKQEDFYPTYYFDEKKRKQLP